MRQLWRVWRTLCVCLVSAAVPAAALIAGAAALGIAPWDPPVSLTPSPDGRYALRVFSAGQGSIPPDYRSGVSFLLRDRARPFWSPDTLVAHAALADGWSVAWTGPASVTVTAGPLSFFDHVLPRAGAVAVHVNIRSRSPEEARCIAEAFGNTANGIVCFDALLGTPAASRP